MQIMRLALCVTLVAGAMFAQTDRGTVTGTVSDPAGAVIAAAVITARNIDTGANFETVTTDTGNYTLPSLPAGTYEISFGAPGFTRSVQRGLRVQVAQTARIDIVLQVGSTTEAVTVNAEAPLLKTESAEQSHTIERDRVNALPLTFAGNLRSPIAFAATLPGASIPSGSNLQMRVNGTPNTTYKALVDGQDITSSIDASHLSEMHPSVEALEEMTLQTSNFAAEFGQVAGGLFNLTTRSGSNRFRGSAYEYLVNEALNAGRPFTNDGSGGLVRPRIRNHNFGVTVGGPVTIPKIYNGRDRTFFFFNYEMFATRSSNAGTFATVPTEAYRRGDFSGALTGRSLGTDALGRPILENQIFDPQTQRVVDGRIVRDPFPGNIIPANRIDPVSAKIQALIPLPSNALAVNNFEQRYNSFTDKSIPSIKIDHNFNSSAKASFYYGRWTQDSQGGDGLDFPISTVRVFRIRTDTIRFTYDHTITPTFLVHAGTGYVRHNNPDSAPASVLQYDAVGQLGLVGSATDPAGFPRLNGLNANNQGGMSLGMGPSNANNYYNDKPTAVLSGTLVRGNHTYKAGGEWRIDIWTDRNSRGAQGIYNFSGAQTGLPYLNSTNVGGGQIGFPYASFLLGGADTASVNSIQDPQLRKAAWGFYAQDSWKVLRKLTLDYGLRWDYQTAPREIFDRMAMFGPSVVNPSAGGRLGGTVYEGYGNGRCNCSFTDSYPFAFGPRLGGAYQLTSSTVLRAGWGITYGMTTNYNYITNQPTLGVGFNTIDFSSPAYGDPAVNLRNGLQYNPALLTVATLDPGIRPTPGQFNAPPYYLDRSGGRPSRINQWNISLQQEIARNLVVEAAYVGNRGVWFQANQLMDLNGISQQRLQSFGIDLNNAADRALLTSRVDSPQAQARGFGAPYPGFPTSSTVAQSIRPYPQFLSIPTRWAALGSTWYDSLQTKVTKRYSHGLDLTYAFTWQKELSLGAENQGGTGAQVNDVFNREVQKAISSSSQPLVSVIAFNYRTPRLGQNRLLNTILADWTVGGVFRYASGLPIRVPGAQNNLNTLLLRSAGGTFANRVPGEPLFLKDLNCHCIDPNKELVLNPKAWSDPALGQWGSSAAYYNDYRYQRRPTEQMSFGKLFRFREALTFEVRGEFFNVFNRTYMTDPDGTNALQTPSFNNQGVPTAGFGRINSGSLFSQPRNGQLLARFQW